jgi:hypothetical protein
MTPFRAAESMSQWCIPQNSGTRGRSTDWAVNRMPPSWTLVLTGNDHFFRKIPERASFGTPHRSVWSNVGMTTSWRKSQCLNKSLSLLFHTPKIHVGTLEPNPETLCRLKTGNSYGEKGKERVLTAFIRKNRSTLQT